MAATKLKLRLAGLRLSAHLERSNYPCTVHVIANNIISGISAAQIGARVNPTLKEFLLEDVAKLEQVLAELR